MLTYVINLDRSKERMARVKKQFENLGLQVIRCTAVDANDLTDDVVERYHIDWRDERRFLFPKDLTRAEIACFLSHKNCWQNLLKSKEEWALIFEDDIVLSDRAQFFCKTPNWIPKGYEFISISIMKPEIVRAKRIAPIDEETALVSFVFPCVMGTQAYFISRRAAQRAIELSEKIYAPVDAFLMKDGSPFSNEFPRASLSPACVTIQNVPSTIDNGAYSRKSHRVILFIKCNPKRVFFKLKSVITGFRNTCSHRIEFK